MRGRRRQSAFRLIPPRSANSRSWPPRNIRATSQLLSQQSCDNGKEDRKNAAQLLKDGILKAVFKHPPPQHHGRDDDALSFVLQEIDCEDCRCRDRRKQRALEIYRRAVDRRTPITIPAPVLGEWWRGRTELREAIVSSVRVEPLTDAIAMLAGEALAEVRNATTIDAFVMASAALRGDVVYTNDVADLEKLRAFFPGVRVLST